jgi:hypothetical protein
MFAVSGSLVPCTGLSTAVLLDMQASPSSNLTGLLALPEEGLAAFIEGDSSAAGAGGSQGLWVLTVVDTAADKASRWVERGWCSRGWSWSCAYVSLARLGQLVGCWGAAPPCGRLLLLGVDPGHGKHGRQQVLRTLPCFG